MTTPEVWRRSSPCSSAACVEVATTPAGAWVRDSKDRRSPVLTFGPGAWTAFLDGLRAGTLPGGEQRA